MSVLNPEVIAGARVPHAVLAGAIAEGQGDLERDERRYRGDRPPLDLRNRIVILVDDGLATGATMRAAVAAVRARSADRVVVAVPVAPPSTCTVLRAEADEVVCLVTPEPFFGVGAWYEDFEQVSDETVRGLLSASLRIAVRSVRRLSLRESTYSRSPLSIIVEPRGGTASPSRTITATSASRGRPRSRT